MSTVGSARSSASENRSVLCPPQLPSARSIKNFLKSRLPPYAVPHVCILLDAIPINMASGKADKKKLPKSNHAEVKWIQWVHVCSTQVTFAGSLVDRTVLFGRS